MEHAGPPCSCAARLTAEAVGVGERGSLRPRFTSRPQVSPTCDPSSALLVSAQVVPGGRTLPVSQSPALPNLWVGDRRGLRGVGTPQPQR